MAYLFLILKTRQSHISSLLKNILNSYSQALQKIFKIAPHLLTYEIFGIVVDNFIENFTV